ncbi:hypothetical protein FRB94_005358 [Tulasnella sp. JGI-2019a]|nr:hypothetical protein FRB94_005358 [Tulasnella sp. JGI-2019a]
MQDHLFGGVAPRLRRLKSTNISIPWAEGLSSNLHTLVITTDGPTAYQIAQVLYGCPLLIELSISYPVTALAIEGDRDYNEDIVQYLTEPLTVHEVSRWCAHNLRELSFNGCYGISLKDILSLVERRLGRLSLGEIPLGPRPEDAEVIRKLSALVDDVEACLSCNEDDDDRYGEGWDRSAGRGGSGV